MSFFDQPFEAEQAPDAPPPNREPIPAGEYQLIVTDAKEVRNRADTGSLVKVTNQVRGGDWDGRKIFDNFNVENPSQKAVEIGVGQLKQLCLACGIKRLSRPEELMGCAYLGDVQIEEASNGFPAKNLITDRRPIGGQAAAAAQSSAPVDDDETAF